MSKRIQVTLPDRLAENLESWADYDGRPLSKESCLPRASARLLMPKKKAPLGTRKIAPKTRKLETSDARRQFDKNN